MKSSKKRGSYATWKMIYRKKKERKKKLHALDLSVFADERCSIYKQKQKVKEMKAALLSLKLKNLDILRELKKKAEREEDETDSEDENTTRFSSSLFHPC